MNNPGSRTCVIFNPAARGERARRLNHLLEEFCHACVLKPTSAPGAARSMTTEAVREGFETIVAAGGDGTLNEVLNGIVDAPGGLARTRLGVLPFGTINVFAREMRIPLNPVRAWTTIREGSELRIDVIRAECAVGPGRERRCFAQLAGAGIDARAVELVDASLKRKVGFWAYVVAGLRALGGTPPQITATTDGWTAQGEQVLIGNGRCYGGPIVMFPRAAFADGKLDVCVFPRMRWHTNFALVAGLLTGGVHRRAGAQHCQARRVTLSASQRVPLELDGELAGELPATFEILEQPLRVIVPIDTVRRLAPRSAT